MPLQLILGDKNPELIEAWTIAFAGIPGITIRGGNILMTKADALVSPANSFGFMDGGFDESISQLFDRTIQPTVQKMIRTKHNGELLVGAAEIVGTGYEQFRYLVCAPTMRVPQNVSNSVNAFLAMRAILLAFINFNEQNKYETILSVAIPGLCTGYGKMPFDRCALQMREAYDIVFGPASNKYRSLGEAIVDEKRYTGKT